jgi:hypothetical protein
LETLIKKLKQIKDLGSKYCQMYQEKKNAFNKMHMLSKTPNGENSDASKEALKEYTRIEENCKNFETIFPKKESSFYYWPTLDSEFFDSINSLKSFIKLKIKLRSGIPEKMQALQKIDQICFEMLEKQKQPQIFHNEIEIIMVGNKAVKEQTIDDLLKLFDSLIEQFRTMIET